MARVETRKKSTRGKEVHCGKCTTPIVPGMQYKTWEFRYGGPRFRCMAPKCAPRASDLTQGQIGRVYELNERLDDACAQLRQDEDFDSFKSEMESIKEDADSLKDEFQGNFDNMPEGLQQGDSGQLLEQRVEALEEFVNELDSSIDNADWPEEQEEDKECANCSMAEDDDRHKKDSPEFDHDFEEPEEELDLSDAVEDVVGNFESISCDCD